MEASKLIDSLGGTSKVSELCQVEPQAVSQWRKNGIPPARLMYLRVIRPDVFAPEKKKKAAQQCHSSAAFDAGRGSGQGAREHGGT